MTKTEITRPISAVWISLLTWLCLSCLGWGSTVWLFSGFTAPWQWAPHWQTLYGIGLYLSLWSWCNHIQKQEYLPRLPFPRWQDIGVGLITGTLIWACLIGLIWISADLKGAQNYPEIPILLDRFAHALLLGLSVASLEERFFRDILLSLYNKTSRPIPSACWQSLLFSVLHLFRPRTPTLLLQIPSLFLSAFLLSLLRYQSQSIAWGIGIHASWITWSSFFIWSECCIYPPQTYGLHRQGEILASPLSWLILSTCIVLFWRYSNGSRELMP